MRLGKLKVGFEQRRGLFMTIGSESGFARESINWTQLHMLRRCEVPGLLPIDHEELDGIVTFRFDLNGYRMLGEALRIVKWTMSDFMNALCRLAEALEDCRLYLLDADRILLADEFIFVGGEGQDIRFTYLPVNAESGSADTIERLVVRWMMRVEELDGQAMQQVLRIVASPHFVPFALRSFIRDYLSSASGLRPKEAKHSPPQFLMLAEPNDGLAAKPERTRLGADKPSGRSWRLLQPPSGDPHALSELLGEGQLAGVSNKAARPPMDPHRRRTLTGAAAAVTVAVSWRFGYMDHPGQSSMLLGLGVTVIALASVLLLWNGTTKRTGRQTKPIAESGNKGDRLSEREDDYPDTGAPRFQVHVSEQRMPVSVNPVFDSRQREQPAETTWLPSYQSDRTEILESSQRVPKASSYLVWETGGDGSRVPLGELSVVIGRSAEAAHHVDETYGISRAHVEVLRIAEQWKVKDLGSRNGSRLNDVPMTPYELYPLQSGDSLTLATSIYRFVQEQT